MELKGKYAKTRDEALSNKNRLTINNINKTRQDERRDEDIFASPLRDNKEKEEDQFSISAHSSDSGNVVFRKSKFLCNIFIL